SASPTASIWASRSSAASTSAASARACCANIIPTTPAESRCWSPTATRSSMTRWAAAPITWASWSWRYRWAPVRANWGCARRSMRRSAACSTSLARCPPRRSRPPPMRRATRSSCRCRSATRRATRCSPMSMPAACR
ncbi:hypothetical protein LTR94_033946, partial [Friedmanniomyces endolithicus]